MLGQVSHVDEGLVAHITLVWTDVVMVTNVIGQLAGLDEPVVIKLKRKKEIFIYYLRHSCVNQTLYIHKVRVSHNVRIGLLYVTGL